MEPHREVQTKAMETNAVRKPRRFRIVKLEERIAPSQGHGGTNNHQCVTMLTQCDCYWTGPRYCYTAGCYNG